MEVQSDLASSLFWAANNQLIRILSVTGAFSKIYQIEIAGIVVLFYHVNL